LEKFFYSFLENPYEAESFDSSDFEYISKNSFVVKEAGKRKESPIHRAAFLGRIDLLQKVIQIIRNINY
jgi:hypothetical protein